MSVSLQDLLADHFESFSRRHGLSREMHRAAWSVIHCRTSRLGGHANRCPQGHYQSIAYNSCGHRSCPQCGWLDKQKWLTSTKRRLLPVPHHHVVFTLPSELRRVWQFNRANLANLLFRVARDTLLELLGDAKYMGARPGILAALHTWNQQLQPHIHLHCLVTAGGLGENGRWQVTKKSCLLPRKVLMIKFRGKFKAMLRQAVNSGRIQLPESLALTDLLSQVSAKPWNVKVHRAYPHGRGVATYLANYIRSGPIKNSRLVAIRDSQVIFRHRLSNRHGGDGRRQTIAQIPLATFLLRWFQHVPPTGFQSVRGYGLYSGNQHSRLDEARSSLGVSFEPSASAQLSWQQWCELAGLTDYCRCPICGTQLTTHARIAPQRGPPSRQPLAPLAITHRYATANSF